MVGAKSQGLGFGPRPSTYKVDTGLRRDETGDGTVWSWVVRPRTYGHLLSLDRPLSSFSYPVHRPRLHGDQPSGGQESQWET